MSPGIRLNELTLFHVYAGIAILTYVRILRQPLLATIDHQRRALTTQRAPE